MGNTRHRNSLAFAQKCYARDWKKKGISRCLGAFMHSVGAWKARAWEPSEKVELGLEGERRRSTKLISQFRILHP